MTYDGNRGLQEKEKLLSWQGLSQSKAMGSLVTIALPSSFSSL